MKTVTATARRYDNVTIFFHWASALLVITQWLGAQTIDWFPRGPMRVDARSVHITFGVLLALILVARIIWRLTGGRRLPPVDQGVLNFVAKATHWALYALLATMVSVGMLLAWARGDSIFNLFSLPAYDAGNPTFSHQMQDVHATIGWIILALAGLHAGAALVHRYVWQDGVLGRMLPTTTEEDI